MKWLKLKLEVRQLRKEIFRLKGVIIDHDALEDDYVPCECGIENLRDDIQEFESAIRGWHDREHTEGWVTCSSEACQIAQRG